MLLFIYFRLLGLTLLFLVLVRINLYVILERFVGRTYLCIALLFLCYLLASLGLDLNMEVYYSMLALTICWLAKNLLIFS